MRIVKSLLLILLLCLTVSARAKYQGIAEKGGKAVKTSTTVTYKLEETFPTCTITIYLTGTTTLASIYSDNAGSIKANPFTANTDASFFFYADDGRYDVKFSGTGIVTPFTKSDILLLDATSGIYYLKNFGVKCDGVSFDSAAAQVAINLVANNAEFKFPTGVCKFNSNLNINGKNGITISGDGIGKTIIDGIGIAEGNRASGAAFVGDSGTIAFSSNSSVTGNTNNSIRDLSILGPTTMGNCTYGSPLCGHSLMLTNQSNFVAERIELNGSLGETFYILAYTGLSNDIKILHSNFKNVLSVNASGVVDTNSTEVTDILIDGCTFEDINFAIHVLGRNARIVNNSFIRIASTGIAVAETNTDATGSLFGAIISKNTFSFLGTGASASGTYGIDVRSRTPLYLNNKQDFGTLVSSNVFVNNVVGGVSSLNCIRLTGSATVSNNYASGIESSPASALSYFLIWDGKQEAINRLYISNNIVQKTLAVNNFNYGIFIAQTTNTFVYLNNNNISAEIFPIYIGAGTYGNIANQPYISFNGDIFSAGDIAVLTSSAIDSSGELDNTPIYGDTTSGLRTVSSLSLATNGIIDLANNTTPTIKGKTLVNANFPAPITVTNLLNSVTGQKLTIWCNNTNMTINNGGNFLLDGNFVCAQFKTITLLRRASDWLEIDRQ